jgi:polyhydroxyalkanoate synthesis regulator protein
VAATDLFLQKYILGGLIVEKQADEGHALLAMSLLQQLHHWR